MAAESSGASAPIKPSGKYSTLADYLFAEPFDFDFFQAVRLLERLFPKQKAVGKTAKPDSEIVRVKTWNSLSFPPSTLYGLKAGEIGKPSEMIVTFMGMTGASGVLPRHYTEIIMRLDREVKGAERYALRDWLDLFSHRFISLFFQAWEKYRFFVAYERGEFGLREQDTFTRGMMSFVGMGTSGMRDRLRVAVREGDELGMQKETVLARIDDLSILWFSGFFAHRPRSAVSLEAMLAAFVRMPVKVKQFQGQWLRLDPFNQSVIGLGNGNNSLGRNVIVGDRIWDVQGKVRIQLGPMNYDQFLEHLPDRSPRPERKALFLLAQLVRLYVGPEVDVEFQLILMAKEVPACKVGRGVGIGARLGWNTWSHRKPLPKDADDPVFQAEDNVYLMR